MSKKKKVSSAKGTTKKVKKVAKPAKKASLKNKKQKPVKKAVAKKPISIKSKKAAKPLKKAVKKAPTKKIMKKAAKPIAKKKEIKKPIKKQPIKAVKVKAIKVEAIKSKPVAKAIVKKEIEKKVLPVLPKKEVEKIDKKALSKVNDEEKKNEVLAIMNTIPKVAIQELPASKIASIASSITNPIKNQGAYSVKSEKEPNGKFEMEFGFRSSPEMLYEFFSTSSGLSEWFCDDVNIRNGIYTFIWDGQMQQARLLKTIDNQLARYQWVDKTDGSYFEFRIQRDDLTNDISLIVTDFAESKADQESAKLLWQSQVEKLMHVIGSIF